MTANYLLLFVVSAWYEVSCVGFGPAWKGSDWSFQIGSFREMFHFAESPDVSRRFSNVTFLMRSEFGLGTNVYKRLVSFRQMNHNPIPVTL